MAIVVRALAIHLAPTTASSAATQVGDALLFAAGWLAVCILSALVYWALTLLIFRRRRHQRHPANRGVLFVALFLVAFAGSNLLVADTFAVHEPLFFLPIAGFFLLFFYLFSDGRYTPTWARWFVLIYGISQIGPLGPQSSKQTNPQAAQVLAHLPGGLVGELITLGFGAIAVVGDIFLVTVIVIGIVPQIYYRYRHLCETGTVVSIQRRTRNLLLIGLVVASFLGLAASELLSQPPSQAPSPVFLSVRTGFFILTTLLPVAGAFALLRGRLYDRDALTNRVLIYGTLTICLILVYVCTTGLRFLMPGLLVSPLVLVFVALVAPIMVALFPPLHAQIQDRIDRRFYRARYDAQRQFTAFGATIGEEGRLDQLSAHLIATIQKAMQCNLVTLWLRTPAAVITPYRASIASLTAGAGSGAARERSNNASSEEIRLRRQAGTATLQPDAPALTLAPDEPARAALLRSSDSIALAQLPEDSPLAGALREDGVTLAIPLLWQGELVGLLALGPRLSGQPYTFDDRELIETFIAHITPTLHLAHVTHEQDVELRQRERVEQELRTARRIQEALLPRSVPTLAGWQLATCYQPAREVGGDFYDFIALANGQLGLVLGDVTDKGIPAALVMATTRSMLRAVAAQPSISPGQVLAQVNELLCPDLPASMFVTCFYAILDPATGHLRFANAGQDLPYRRRADDGSVSELHATGMPLGLLPGSAYEEGEATLAPGDNLLFYSDGLVEAHNPRREMFGLPRLQALLQSHHDGTPPLVFLLHELAAFTGDGWEQEDDITLVAVERVKSADLSMDGMDGSPVARAADTAGDKEETTTWRTLDAWTLASMAGAERQAIARVAQAVHDLPLAPERLERLQTAVGEAVTNAIEHGNDYQPERPVALVVRASASTLSVSITDQGGQATIPDEPETPDLGAKLAGLQGPRGWGLFLMRSLVDDVQVTSDGTHHTVELILSLGDATPE